MTAEQDAKIVNMLECAEELVLAFKAAFPKSSRQSILSGCATACNMALDEMSQKATEND